MAEEGKGLAGLAASEPEVASEATVELVRAEPDAMTEAEQALIAEVASNVSEVVAAAEAVQVRTAEEAQTATEFLARVKVQLRAADLARTRLVKPLNDHVKMINAQFKPGAEQLEEAERIVKGKVLGWRAEEEAKAAEEQARLDAEREAREREVAEQRRREEAEAQAAREEAAREATRREQERIAREEEAARLEARLNDELAEEMRGLSDGALTAAALSPAKRGAAAKAELGRREAVRAAARAERESAAAAEAEREARAAEAAVREAPLPDVVGTQVAPSGPVRAPSGSAVVSKRWVATVEDESKVPREYLMVDTKKLNQAVKDGVRDIAGVRIAPEESLAVRAPRKPKAEEE